MTDPAAGEYIFGNVFLYKEHQIGKICCRTEDGAAVLTIAEIQAAEKLVKTVELLKIVNEWMQV